VYIYTYIYTYLYEYTYIYIYIYVHECVNAYIYINVCKYTVWRLGQTDVCIMKTKKRAIKHSDDTPKNKIWGEVNACGRAM